MKRGSAAATKRGSVATRSSAATSSSVRKRRLVRWGPRVLEATAPRSRFQSPTAQGPLEPTGSRGKNFPASISRSLPQTLAAQEFEVIPKPTNSDLHEAKKCTTAQTRSRAYTAKRRGIASTNGSSGKTMDAGTNAINDIPARFSRAPEGTGLASLTNMANVGNSAAGDVLKKLFAELEKPEDITTRISRGIPRWVGSRAGPSRRRGCSSRTSSSRSSSPAANAGIARVRKMPPRKATNYGVSPRGRNDDGQPGLAINTALSSLMKMASEGIDTAAGEVLANLGIRPRDWKVDTPAKDDTDDETISMDSTESDSHPQLSAAKLRPSARARAPPTEEDSINKPRSYSAVVRPSSFRSGLLAGVLAIPRLDLVKKRPWSGDDSYNIKAEGKRAGASTEAFAMPELNLAKKRPRSGDDHYNTDAEDKRAGAGPLPPMETPYFQVPLFGTPPPPYAPEFIPMSVSSRAPNKRRRIDHGGYDGKANVNADMTDCVEGGDFSDGLAFDEPALNIPLDMAWGIPDLSGASPPAAGLPEWQTPEKGCRSYYEKRIALLMADRSSDSLSELESDPDEDGELGTKSEEIKKAPTKEAPDNFIAAVNAPMDVDATDEEDIFDMDWSSDSMPEAESDDDEDKDSTIESKSALWSDKADYLLKVEPDEVESDVDITAATATVSNKQLVNDPMIGCIADDEAAEMAPRVKDSLLDLHEDYDVPDDIKKHFDMTREMSTSDCGPRTTTLCCSCGNAVPVHPYCDYTCARCDHEICCDCDWL